MEALMNVPLELTFRGLEKTPEIEALIRHNAEKLEKICSYVSSCRVVIERDQQHQRIGHPFRVRLDITVPPRNEFAVRRESTEGELHDPLSKIINEAFKAASRRLQKTVDLQRHASRVKPNIPTQGIVTRLFLEDEYGFITTPEGEDIYFHAKNVANGEFDKLIVGTAVHFAPHFGDNGLHASSVRIPESSAGLSESND